jgi:hypothetical protein
MGRERKGAGPRAIWGAAYDAIPKNVFALAAWNMAAQLAGECDDGDAEARFAHEVATLAEGGHVRAETARLALLHLPAPHDAVGAEFSEGKFGARVIADAAAMNWRKASDAAETMRVVAMNMPISAAKLTAQGDLVALYRVVDARLTEWRAAFVHAATYP